MCSAQNQVDGVNFLVKMKLVLRHDPKTASITALSVGSTDRQQLPGTFNVPSLSDVLHQNTFIRWSADVDCMQLSVSSLQRV